LRIVQEALTNVHHAAATRVSIDLRSIGKQTHLLIRDHGLDTGIDRANGGQRGGPLRLGVGIPGMSARMQQLGGKLDIRSSRRGTTVHAAMPVRSGFCRPSEGLIIARTPVAPHRGVGLSSCSGGGC
jgi:signal transduction histidine kinase